MIIIVIIKIVLYQNNGDEVEDITDPYTFIDLTDGTYTFTLQIENDDLSPNPPIDNSMNITMKVPTVKIDSPLDDAIIYNNTFDLSYNVTNLGTDNKIVLYQGTDISYNVTTNPYIITDLVSDIYTFKLQIENDILTANPPIDSSMNITMKVPTVEIANTDTTIYNNTFDLSYNVTNLGTDNKIVLYQGTDISYNVTGPYTFTGLESQSYIFKLQVENDILTANPPIDSSMNITMKVPTVKIDSPANGAIINSNVFDLSYNVTNLGDVNNTYNKIILYQTDGTNEKFTDITSEVSPYQVKVSTSDSYTFKLQIFCNDIMSTSDPVPAIDSSMNITMEIPVVEITSPLDHPLVTIDVNSFDIFYDVEYMPTSSHLQLYTRNVGDISWNLVNLVNIDILPTSTSNSIEVPLSDPSGNLQFKLQIENDSDNAPTTNAEGNSDTTAIRTHILPQLTVHYAEKKIIEDDEERLYTNYYFKQSTGSFTLQYDTDYLEQWKIDILLIGGGGGGGWDGGDWGSGGGGAGAYVTGTINPSSNDLYNITIGPGGDGNGVSGNGVSSSITTGTTTTVVEALGGGRGGDNTGTVNGGQGSNTNPTNPDLPYTVPLSGPVGSGGGGSGQNPAASIPGYSYTYTYDGFTYSMNSGGYGHNGGGGGGGAGAIGTNAGGWEGGNGGIGKQWTEGDKQWYAGGGTGQGVWDYANRNNGGKGGGGGNGGGEVTW